jgi:ABC-type transport system involved in cytochrome bd biosynthesis fused ATPase/permease subunit
MNYLCICSGGIVRSVACAALLREQGADAIPISHKHTSTVTFDLMCRWANKIIVMHKGEIREMGTHQELLAHGGIYYKLYQLQYKEQEIRDAPTLSG